MTKPRPAKKATPKKPKAPACPDVNQRAKGMVDRIAAKTEGSSRRID